MINKAILQKFNKVEKRYHQKFGDGYLALTDPLHPLEKDYVAGIAAMEKAIKDNKPLPVMAEGLVY